MATAVICPASRAQPGPMHDLAPADPHCPPPHKRCGWVICRACNAVVDPKRGTWHAGPTRPAG